MNEGFLRSRIWEFPQRCCVRFSIVSRHYSEDNCYNTDDYFDYWRANPIFRIFKLSACIRCFLREFYVIKTITSLIAILFFISISFGIIIRILPYTVHLQFKVVVKLVLKWTEMNNKSRMQISRKKISSYLWQQWATNEIKRNI